MSEVKKIATRESYGKTLLELGAEMPNLVVLDADLAGATKTGIFKKAFPDRHIDCGIAEGNMMSVAAEDEQRDGEDQHIGEKIHAHAAADAVVQGLSVHLELAHGARMHIGAQFIEAVFAQDHDRMFQDGRLRNAYVSGDPKSDSGRSIVGKKVTVRLPGFWQDGRWQEDYYTVSTSSGNMAWVILALCKASEIAPEDNKEIYINGAKRAADFLLTLRADNGGFSGGYEGWDENQVLATYKSTEHNIDIACAYRLLASVIEETDQVKANEYIEASEYAKQFVFSMYDSKLHCFYTGTADDGKTRSEGVVPLDANSLAILAFGNDLADKDKILEFIEKRISVDDGYDFSAGDGDGIWNEGTAQMALCYAGTGDQELYGSILSYLDSQTDEEGIMPAANRDGLSPGFLLGGTGDIWEFNNEESISATAWYSLAQMAVNPFAM